MVRIIYLLTLILFILSCSSSRFPYDTEGLTYKGRLLFNKQIKMDGYFYRIVKNITEIDYFFENGYYRGGTREAYIIEHLCSGIDSTARKIPYSWGCYIIEHDTLKVQQIAPYGRDKYRKFMVIELWAKIEDNGSTLRYFQKKDIDGKINVIDEVYKFHPCINKPSSTNILMQEKKK
jgi:hypothetical protein